MYEYSNDIESVKKLISDVIKADALPNRAAFCKKYDINQNYLTQILNGHTKLSHKMFLHLTAIHGMAIGQAHARQYAQEPASPYGKPIDTKMRITVTMTLDGTMVQSHNITVDRL